MHVLPPDHSMLNERKDDRGQDQPKQSSNIEFKPFTLMISLRKTAGEVSGKLQVQPTFEFYIFLHSLVNKTKTFPFLDSQRGK